MIYDRRATEAGSSGGTSEVAAAVGRVDRERQGVARLPPEEGEIPAGGVAERPAVGRDDAVARPEPDAVARARRSDRDQAGVEGMRVEA